MHMRQASRFSGVTIRVRCSDRGGGEELTEACKCKRSAVYW